VQGFQVIIVFHSWFESVWYSFLFLENSQLVALIKYAIGNAIHTQKYPKNLVESALTELENPCLLNVKQAMLFFFPLLENRPQPS
jgi:hypothetical protein